MNNHSRQARRKRFTAIALGEWLENRRLLSTTTFTVVPAQTELSLAVSANFSGLGATFTAQGTSTLNSSENSLTTHFTGTLLADVETNTLSFTGGSSVVAENNGSWYPGDSPDPNGGNAGNATTALPADFGGVANLGFFGNEYAACRNLAFDFSTLQPITYANGGYQVGNGLNPLNVESTHGTVYFDTTGSGAAGTSDLTAQTGSNQTTQLATLQTVGQTETLTVPIDASYEQLVDNVDVTTVYSGTLVATATLPLVIQPSPSYYLKLDADSQHVDIRNNSTGTGTVTQQYLYSQQSTLTLTASTGTGTITIDNSAGNVIPPGGLTIAGNGSTALKLLGTGNGDTVTLNAAQFVDNGVAINFSGVTQTVFDPTGGTDVLGVNAGTLVLAAPVSPAGITVRKFSTLSIAASADLQVAAPASHATRQLVETSALSIAGSTGHWTGTLDLTGNDLDLQGGVLTTATNQVTQGYNASGGGRWNGAGLTSSTANGDTKHLTALGVIQNNQSGTAIFGSGTGQHLFDGIIPATSDVLVKYTFFGDAILDGNSDGSDYSRIDNGAKNHLTGWFNGDFNYDGTVNGSDYALIDNVYNTRGASLAAEVTAPDSTPAAATPNFPATNAAPNAPVSSDTSSDADDKKLRRYRFFSGS